MDVDHTSLSIYAVETLINQNVVCSAYMSCKYIYEKE